MSKIADGEWCANSAVPHRSAAEPSKKLTTRFFKLTS
jgi:hypothetical protein